MDFVGEVFENKVGKKFEIKEFVKRDSHNRYYRLKFLSTGYTMITTKSAIKRGYIKDKYAPSVCGVGYLGDIDNTRDFKKERNLWGGMLNRCYNVNNNGYKHYGAKGVTVCDRWLSFENFLKDLPKIDGYDKNLFDLGHIELDKDMKQRGASEKVYSLNGCMFISKKKNSRFSANRQSYSFLATNAKGESTEEYNVSSFAKENKLSANAIYNCINGYQKTHKGWSFERL